MKRKYARKRRLTWGKIPTSLLLREPEKIFLTRAVARAVPYTQLKYGALVQMCDLIDEVDKNDIPGSIVEMGCGRGGCGALMAHRTERNGSNREVWLFDSFEGLSEPVQQDIEGSIKPLDRVKKGYLEVGKEVAEEALKVMGLECPERVHFVKGWFEESVPGVKEEIGQIAILRLDADLYEPTKYALEELYEQVSPGGYVVFDDYKNWIGCRRAVHEFFCNHNIHPNLQSYQYDGKTYFQKPML